MPLAEKESTLNERVYHLQITDCVDNAAEFTDLNVHCKVKFVYNDTPHKGFHPVITRDYGKGLCPRIQVILQHNKDTLNYESGEHVTLIREICRARKTLNKIPLLEILLWKYRHW